MAKVTAGKTLSSQVMDNIKDMIAQGIYQKGDLLPSERELMEMMGVGRITVRSALGALSEAGVIKTVKGKGSFVQVDVREMQGDQEQLISRQHFIESTEVRLLLEPTVAREVALRCDLATREALGRCFSDAAMPEDFHKAIFEAAGNSVLLDIFARLNELEVAPPKPPLVQPLFQESFFSKVQEQHERIYEAILAGNGEYAYFYMKEHLEFVKKTYEEYFSYFSAPQT